MRGNQKSNVSETSTIRTGDLSFDQLDGTNNGSDPGKIEILNKCVIIKIKHSLFHFFFFVLNNKYFFQVTTTTTAEDTHAGKPTSPQPVKPDEMNPNGNLTGGITPKPEPDETQTPVPTPTPDDVKPDDSKNDEGHKPASPQPPPQPPEPDKIMPGPKPDSPDPEPVRSKKDWMKSNCF